VNIGDGEVRSADVKDESLTTFDVSTFLGADVVDGTLTSADIKDGSLGNGDLLSGSVDGRVVTDNSLTGTDVNESSLNMPPTTTATFANGSATVGVADSLVKVASKTLPAGSWAIVATANMDTVAFNPRPSGPLRASCGMAAESSAARPIAATGRGAGDRKKSVDERRGPGAGRWRRGEPVVLHPGTAGGDLGPDDDHPARRVLLIRL
jgi:hypothetical protein